MHSRYACQSYNALSRDAQFRLSRSVRRDIAGANSTRIREFLTQP